MGLAPDLDLSCVDASADLVRPLLSEPGEPAALLRRLELAVASYQRAAQCAKGASANTNTNTNRASSLTPLQSGGGGALRPEQQMWNNAVHDLEQSHGLARQRYEQELTVREGNGQTDSPDEPSLLRRQAKGALAHHQLGKAVAALERAVQILTLAFGAQDAETIAATAELRAAQHGAAGSEATQGSLQACEARLLGRLETSQETLSALRSYHALSKSGRPVPPAAYGAACRALRGEDEFGDEQWSDPIVSQPLADAAQQSIALVPRAAVAEQVNALLLQAARLGVGPGPDFSSACPRRRTPARSSPAQPQRAARGSPHRAGTESPDQRAALRARHFCRALAVNAARARRAGAAPLRRLPSRTVPNKRADRRPHTSSGPRRAPVAARRPARHRRRSARRNALISQAVVTSLTLHNEPTTADAPALRKRLAQAEEGTPGAGQPVARVARAEHHQPRSSQVQALHFGGGEQAVVAGRKRAETARPTVGSR